MPINIWPICNAVMKGAKAERSFFRACTWGDECSCALGHVVARSDVRSDTSGEERCARSDVRVAVFKCEKGLESTLATAFSDEMTSVDVLNTMSDQKYARKASGAG
jgi:hypothetical protein